MTENKSLTNQLVDEMTKLGASDFNITYTHLTFNWANPEPEEGLYRERGTGRIKLSELPTNEAEIQDRLTDFEWWMATAFLR